MTLHQTVIYLRIKRGLQAALLSNATASQGQQGEPYYTTDTKQLYIHDGTAPAPVQSLDMALTHGGEVLTIEGDILYYA